MYFCVFVGTLERTDISGIMKGCNDDVFVPDSVKIIAEFDEKEQVDTLKQSLKNFMIV